MKETIECLREKFQAFCDKMTEATIDIAGHRNIAKIKYNFILGKMAITEKLLTVMSEARVQVAANLRRMQDELQKLYEILKQDADPDADYYVDSGQLGSEEVNDCEDEVEEDIFGYDMEDTDDDLYDPDPDL